MTDKIVAAVLLGVTAWLHYYVGHQEMFPLEASAYMFFTLLTIAYMRRAKS